MARYSEEFKYSIIKRMMPPTNESVKRLQEKQVSPKDTSFMEETSQSKWYCSSWWGARDGKMVHSR